MAYKKFALYSHELVQINSHNHSCRPFLLDIVPLNIFGQAIKGANFINSKHCNFFPINF